METSAENKSLPKIRPLNLRKRLRFSAERLAHFGELFVPACRRWETPLSQLLRTSVSVKLGATEQISWKNISLNEAYARNLSTAELPTAGVVCENALLFPMLDRMLGAGGVGTVREANGPILTRLEEKLSDRIFSQIYTGAMYPWRKDDEPKTLELCSSPEFPFTPREALLRVPFTLTFASVSGTVALLFSASQVETLWEDYTHKHPEMREISRESEILKNPPWQREEISTEPREMADVLGAAMVDVSVQMSGKKITPKSLGNWHIGEVLSLEKTEDTPFDVLVEGVSQFHAAAGKYKTRKVFRIV